MVCCVFQATNLVNNYRQRKSARAFVSKLELAINYIRCWHFVIFIQLLFTFFCYFFKYNSLKYSKRFPGIIIFQISFFWIIFLSESLFPST